MHHSSDTSTTRQRVNSRVSSLAGESCSYLRRARILVQFEY